MGETAVGVFCAERRVRVADNIGSSISAPDAAVVGTTGVSAVVVVDSCSTVGGGGGTGGAAGVSAVVVSCSTVGGTGNVSTALVVSCSTVGGGGGTGGAVGSGGAAGVSTVVVVDSCSTVGGTGNVSTAVVVVVSCSIAGGVARSVCAVDNIGSIGFAPGSSRIAGFESAPFSFSCICFDRNCRFIFASFRFSKLLMMSFKLFAAISNSPARLRSSVPPSSSCFFLYFSRVSISCESR